MSVNHVLFYNGTTSTYHFIYVLSLVSVKYNQDQDLYILCHFEVQSRVTALTSSRRKVKPRGNVQELVNYAQFH
jgi:hypothetical protein